MLRQSRTTIKELSAQYRSVLKRAFLAGVIALATANAAHATITAEDISAINDSINMVQSDGNYTTSMGDYNVATTDYSTVAGYGQYTYDHDNNPETAEIALTTNNGTETLDNTVFTYTDNNGETTNLGVNATGFTTSDFTGAAGTIDVADGTTDLTTLEANTTTVGLGNYQYMANFDNSGDALTALTADAPELSSFHNDIALTTGSITVNGDNEVNKPSIDQYGFTVDLHDGSTGNFDLVYNELTHSYDYNYTGDVTLDASDIAKASAQVASQSANLIADTTAFNTAVGTNETNYTNALGHYNNVHGVYESDANAQNTLDTNYVNYETSFAAAQANQSAAGQNLSNAQNAYADDLAVYNSTATAYNNYTNSLGQSIDAKDEAVLASAQDYADSLADNYDAAGSADTAEQNAKDYADSLADNYDAAGSANTAEQNAKDYADSLADNYDAAGSADTAEQNAKDYADSLADNYDAAGSANTAEQNAKDYADNQIASEASARESADAELQGLITTEASTREEKDITLQSNIDAEAAARESADNELQTLIATEASTRADEDAAIRSEFADADDAVRGEFAAADADLQDAIDNEVARATAQEQTIRNDFAAGDAATLARANAYTDQRVDTLEKNVSGGVAAATALSSVAVSNVKRGEVSVGAGYGYYNDQSAVAFGAAMGLTDRWSVNAGAGLATGDKTQMSFRAGTNYKFKLF